MDIVTNPVFIGASAGLITFGLMKYQTDNSNKKRAIMGKRKREVDLIIPLIVAIFVFFVAYFVKEGQSMPNTPSPFPAGLVIPPPPFQAPAPAPALTQLGGGMAGVVGGPQPSWMQIPERMGTTNVALKEGIKVPTKLPNILIDAY